ncbi:hypothetical protein [Priestia aryabhattai]
MTKYVKYVVIKDFKDLKDSDKIYTEGDIYPRPESKKPTKKRLNELLGNVNKQGRPVIKEVPLTKDEIEELEEQELEEQE